MNISFLTCIIDIKSSFPAINGAVKFFNSITAFGCGHNKLYMLPLSVLDLLGLSVPVSREGTSYTGSEDLLDSTDSWLILLERLFWQKFVSVNDVVGLCIVSFSFKKFDINLWKKQCRDCFFLERSYGVFPVNVLKKHFLCKYIYEKDIFMINLLCTPFSSSYVRICTSL